MTNYYEFPNTLQFMYKQMQDIIIVEQDLVHSKKDKLLSLKIVKTCTCERENSIEDTLISLFY